MVDVNPAPESQEQVTPPAPGEKTDSALLLKSLQEERELRRKEQEAREKAEKELQEFKESSAHVDEFSDEGKVILSRVATLETELATSREREAMTGVQAQYPVLKDKQTEFDEFRKNPENAGMSLATAAKAFVIENDLVVAPKIRKGLEAPSSGGHTPTKQGMTPEEIDHLRETNFRKYSDMVRKGEFTK